MSPSAIVSPPSTPIKSSSNPFSYDTILARYKDASQDHVLNFYSALSTSEKSALLDQLSSIDVDRVNRIFHGAMEAERVEKLRSERREAGKNSPLPGLSSEGTLEGSEGLKKGLAALLNPNEDEILPLPASACASIVPSTSASSTVIIENTQKWESIGLKAIAKGQVAVLLMAGGQGTRLGSSNPKGCYDIGLPSKKSLFRLQAERIAKLGQLAQATLQSEQSNGSKPSPSLAVPWYVMTSGPTRKETEAFFKENKYFGLQEKDVVFFNQGVLPALSNDGKLLLSSPNAVAVAPDGNGGLYAAIRQPLSATSRRTVLSDMHSRGIKYVHAYCVDNCLVRVADPVFIGHCIEKGSDCGAKVVRKESPHESVGVLAMKGQNYSVVEYSELSKDKAEARDADNGELSFRAANIANHFYTLDFLDQVEGMEASMAFHIARKKIPTIDIKTGSEIKPTEPNGMKLEMFVFDVFPFTHNLAVLEVARQEEFSPLKNAPGSKSDNPETSRRDLLAQQKRWIMDAGAKMGDGIEIEVGPLVSYAGEGLESLKGKVFTKSGVVDNLSEFEKLV